MIILITHIANSIELSVIIESKSVTEGGIDTEDIIDLYYSLKEQYVKITVLDWAENPIKDIQGKVINGNLNLDGKSSMRRAANLDMTIEDSQETNITSIKNI